LQRSSFKREEPSNIERKLVDKVILAADQNEKTSVSNQ